MSVNSQSFNQILTTFSTMVQGNASALTNFVIGSILRAVGEATAWVSLWLQGLILTVIALTRAATSNGPDLDSWLAQFGFFRLAPTAASGQVTFSRFTPTSQAVISVGSIVQSADGTQQYQVVVDTTNAAYNATLNGFVIASGVSSVIVSVVSITPGNNSLNLPDASGNAVVGAISALFQSIPFVDTVTNAIAFTNGENAESDPSVRIRFVGWLASLAKATGAAIGAAITALGANFSYVLGENMTYAGLVQMGYFYVVVDDGTGAPSSGTLSTVYNAVDAVRPFTSTFGVFPPVKVMAVVSLAINTISTGPGHVATTAIVQTAILSYLNTLPLGASVNYFKLGQVAIDASSDVTGVESLLLNGVASDLTITNLQIVKSTSVTVV